MNLVKNRFLLFWGFFLYYLIASFLVRIVLYVLSCSSIEFSILSTLKIFFLGFIYDLNVAFYFLLFYAFYLFIIPKFLIGSKIDKFFTYFVMSICVLISLFSFFAEFPFWDEFGVRFNFIAVDYLIYTYEVVENINQSYPLPFLISGMIALTVLIMFMFHKFNLFKKTFSDKIGFTNRLIHFSFCVIILVVFSVVLSNKQAEFSTNTYQNELTKNGCYSFFSAFRSNELDYDLFYPKLPKSKAFNIIQKELGAKINNTEEINRKIFSDSTEIHPNIVLICVESLSAEFLKRFGNTQNLTPNLDKIANESILFTNLYATGTRTVRGMEALTLSVPPTPGNSILRRPNNHGIFSIGNVVKSKNYSSYFVYGGDGYFDNMNNFFGGQGFNIIDRNRGNPMQDDIQTERTNITDQEVSFENAWGISDQDIYQQLLKKQDENYSKQKKSLFFVMTTSNHKPYTFPENTIDLPQGTREAAVKYTDYAIGKYINQARKKPWFKNTVFVLVADHCASSAGKWEINIQNHHIPAMIYNTGKKPIENNLLVSQIDLLPTLFGILNWNYNSEFYGKDVFKMNPSEQRSFVGNYRTLGMLTPSYYTEINDKKQIKNYHYNFETKNLTPIKTNNSTNLTIAYYQTASERFKNGLMKLNK